MNNLPINKQTEHIIQSYISRPTQALLLEGPTGSGKYNLAIFLRDQLLSAISSAQREAYTKIVRPEETKSLSINDIRELEKFLSLKVPIRQAINRVVLIPDSQLLSIEAQNALLKTLEEPPQGTVLILTADEAQSLLPTLRSRLQVIKVEHPSIDELRKFFGGQGHSKDKINQAITISGGLPVLTDSILNNKDNPLLQATEKVRELLAQSTFERLAQVDSLYKDKELCIDILFIFHQMARVSLLSSTSKSKQWQSILSESYDAREALLLNAQPKLVLTNFMLSI